MNSHGVSNMSLSDALKGKNAKPPINRTIPLWDGPESNTPNGGITYSLISRWLCCRERFRLLVIQGLKPTPCFYPPIDYGNMWHICEEEWSGNCAEGIPQVMSRLRGYCQQLCRSYPTQQQVISHWYEICKAQFPIYVDYWRRQRDQQKLSKRENSLWDTSRKSITQEQSFGAAYKLPSQRVVWLRGKWDAIDSVGNRLWLVENKTKSTIDQHKIVRQLSFDLQTMLYLVALQEKQEHDFFNRSNKSWRDHKIAGVLYNVVRRSAHKSVESMVKKIREDESNGRMDEWFARWEVAISQKDIEVFKDKCLNPILEAICYWWDWINDRAKPSDSPYNTNMWSWRHPFGVYNILDEGGSSDLDYYLQTGSEVGLTRVDNLFPEL